MDYMTTKMEAMPSSGFAYDLVNSVARGEVVPVTFQRSYVWERKHVLALFRSIMLGISMGSFLIWEPSPDMSIETLGRERLGPVLRKREDKLRRSTKLLLDGQNRLATIAWARHVGSIDEKILAEVSDQECEIWCSGDILVLDYASRSICFMPESELNEGLRLPLSTVIRQDNKALFAAADYWEKKLNVPKSDLKEMIDLYDHCGRRIMGARAVDVTIKNATVDEAREVFLNVCQAGVPMSQEDFDKAFHWSSQDQ